jgi:hypothetical protein
VTSFFDRLKNEVTAAVVLIGGIMLATGYLLTWARLENEELPSREILTALPRTYFVTVAVESMLTPLVIAIVMSAGWLPFGVALGRRASLPEMVAGWGCFGAALGWVAVSVVTLINGASYHPRVSWLIATAGSAAVAAAAAGILHHFGRGDAPATWWGRARPVLATAAVLCFAVTCAVRVVDARFTGGGLPFAQVVTALRCPDLVHGIAPTAEAKDGSCQVGGYYLGANGDSILLVQRRHPCPADPPAAPPQLLMIARAVTQMVVARDEPPAGSPCRPARRSAAGR